MAFKPGEAMIILLILAIMFAIGSGYWIFGRYSTKDNGMLVTIIAGLLIVVFLGMLSGVYYDTMSEINQYNTAVISIETARETDNLNDYERAALTLKIITMNEWLANVQYWNDSMWDEFIPDEVMNLQPVK